MSPSIALILTQDGVVNGAVYALLALSLVLVFAVTRIIFIPQGEFVAFGALSYAALDRGAVPGSVWLLGALAVAAFLIDFFADRRDWRRLLLLDVLLPAAVIGAVVVLAPWRLGAWMDAVLALALVTPMGPFVYRVAFQPMAQASVLVLLIAAVGVHLTLVGLGLGFFGAEGVRGPGLGGGSFTLGPLFLRAQAVWIVLATVLLMIGLFGFFRFTLTGKALRATAVNRLGARLVGIGTAASGRLAFGMAALIGALSGVLIAPLTTVYYDSGFIIGLKGFVAAIIGGMASYPVAALAAMLVGVVEAFAAFWASPFKEVIVFTTIIPVLLWRSVASRAVEEDE